MMRALRPASGTPHKGAASPSGSASKASTAGRSPASAISPSASSPNARLNHDTSPQAARQRLPHPDKSAVVLPPPAELILQAISPTRHDSPDLAPRPSPRSSHSPPSVRQRHNSSGQPRSESSMTGRAGLLGTGHAAGEATCDADDDMCRMSSVRDTPASSVATTKASKAARPAPAESKSTSRPSKGTQDVPAALLVAHGSSQVGQSSRPSPRAGRDAAGASSGRGKQSRVVRSGGRETAAGRDPAHDGIPRAGATTSPPLPKPR